MLEGEATLRLGSQEVPVRAGDYVALPVGPESAHQLTNTGAATLRYLCVSTLQPTDVVVFPDMRTIGVMAVPSMEAARRGEHWVRLMVPANGAPSPSDENRG